MPLLKTKYSFELMDFIEFILKQFTVDNQSNKEIYERVNKWFVKFEEESQDGRMVDMGSDSILPEGTETYTPPEEELDDAIEIDESELEEYDSSDDSFTDPAQLAEFIKQHNL